MAISEEAVQWAFRLLLGREVPDQATLDAHKNGYDTVKEMTTTFMAYEESRRWFTKNNAPTYMIPPFLLRAPESPDTKWNLSEPSLMNPVCQFVTANQISSSVYKKYCDIVGIDHNLQNRKHWEIAYILSVVERNGLLTAGRRGLGFGTGREPLPSVFANMGVKVTATDAPQSLDSTQNWTSNLDDLYKPELVAKDKFYNLVSFLPADMNSIPVNMRDFDFCWSDACLQHLGSIEHGLKFIKNSLDTLRPGGLAVHTTEFNLTSNRDTIDGPGLCLFRKQDIEKIAVELTKAGHHVAPLNFWPGTEAIDEHIDLPPYGSSPHLKLALADYVTTSFGIIVRKSP